MAASISSTALGRFDCLSKPSTPRVLKVWRTLRTVWTEQPTNCAMGFGDSRRALARTIWARRTRKASTVRRSASNWIRSLSVKGRINIGGFIAQVYQLEAQLHKNSCGDALVTLGWGNRSLGEQVPAPHGEVRIVDKHPLNWTSITMNVFEHLMDLDKDGKLVPR